MYMYIYIYIFACARERGVGRQPLERAYAVADCAEHGGQQRGLRDAGRGEAHNGHHREEGLFAHAVMLVGLRIVEVGCSAV